MTSQPTELKGCQCQPCLDDGPHSSDCAFHGTDIGTPGNGIISYDGPCSCGASGIYKDRLIRAQNRKIRKLQDKINRFTKLVPGSQRIWKLDSIAMGLEMEAEERAPWGALSSAQAEMNRAELRADALFLRRLQFDLHQQRDTVRGPRGGRMTEVENYYMRERP